MWKIFSSREIKVEGTVCVSCAQDGIAFAHVLSGAANFGIKVCEFLPCDDENKQSEVLKEYVIEHKLEDADCVYVLQPHEYRLILIDAPNVANTELKDATRWAVMDFVDFPIDDAAIDTFDVPVLPGQKQKLYVIITRKTLLQRVEKLISQSRLNLCRIDIAELTLCRAMGQLHHDNESLALLFSNKENYHLIIEKDNMLYFERRFEGAQGNEIEKQNISAASDISVKVEDNLSQGNQTMTKSTPVNEAGKETQDISKISKSNFKKTSEESGAKKIDDLSSDNGEEYLIVDSDTLETPSFQYTNKADADEVQNASQEKLNMPNQGLSTEAEKVISDEQNQDKTGAENQSTLLAEKIAITHADQKSYRTQKRRSDDEPAEGGDETEKKMPRQSKEELI